MFLLMAALAVLSAANAQDTIYPKKGDPIRNCLIDTVNMNSGLLLYETIENDETYQRFFPIKNIEYISIGNTTDKKCSDYLIVSYTVLEAEYGTENNIAREYRVTKYKLKPLKDKALRTAPVLRNRFSIEGGGEFVNSFRNIRAVIRGRYAHYFNNTVGVGVHATYRFNNKTEPYPSYYRSRNNLSYIYAGPAFCLRHYGNNMNTYAIFDVSVGPAGWKFDKAPRRMGVSYSFSGGGESLLGRNSSMAITYTLGWTHILWKGADFSAINLMVGFRFGK